MPLRLIVLLVIFVASVALFFVLQAGRPITGRALNPAVQIHVGTAARCGTEIKIACPYGFTCNRKSVDQKMHGECEPGSAREYRLDLPRGNMSFLIPGEWRVREDIAALNNQRIIFSDSRGYVSIVVTIKSGLSPSNLSAASATDFDRDNLLGTLLESVDQRSGERRDELTMNLPDGTTDLQISGFGEEFDTVLRTLEFNY